MMKQTMLLGAVALFGAAAFASETKLLEELIAIGAPISFAMPARYFSTVSSPSAT